MGSYRGMLSGALAGLLACVGGCAGYHPTFAETYKQGVYAQAELQLNSEGGKAIANPNNGDHLIYLLEQGTILRATGRLDESNKAFDRADAYFTQVDQKAYVRVGREGYAAVTNLAELSYEGYGYDRIMANAYKALNYMEQGNLEFARAELKRVANVQEHMKQHKDKRIREAEEARKEKGGQFNADRAMSDRRFVASQSAVYSNLPDNQHLALYVNPFAEYLQGIFYLHNGDPQDREIGLVALKNARAMVPQHEYLDQDLAMGQRMTSGGVPEAVTYVIFETGMAPQKKEIRIDIPIFLYNIMASDTGVDYVGVAFPTLEMIPGGMPTLTARTAAGTYPTQLIVDMDAVVAKEFKDELPAVITRTVIAAGTKAALAYAANQATQQNGNGGWVNLITRVATTAYQLGLNKADLRSWRTLPKMITISRFPTPTDGTVALISPQGTLVANTTVKPGVTNIIWVRSPSDFSPAVCRSFPLAPRSSQTTAGAGVNPNTIIGQR